MQEFLDLDMPTPMPGEMLVEVRAAGVNPVDWKIRSGMFGAASEGDLPAVLGSEVSGVVREVGQDVDGFAVGRRDIRSGGSWVWWICRAHSGHRERRGKEADTAVVHRRGHAGRGGVDRVRRCPTTRARRGTDAADQRRQRRRRRGGGPDRPGFRHQRHRHGQRGQEGVHRSIGRHPGAVRRRGRRAHPGSDARRRRRDLRPGRWRQPGGGGRPADRPHQVDQRWRSGHGREARRALDRERRHARRSRRSLALWPRTASWTRMWKTSGRSTRPPRRWPRWRPVTPEARSSSRSADPWLRARGPHQKSRLSKCPPSSDKFARTEAATVDTSATAILSLRGGHNAKRRANQYRSVNPCRRWARRSRRRNPGCRRRPRCRLLRHRSRRRRCWGWPGWGRSTPRHRRQTTRHRWPPERPLQARGREAGSSRGPLMSLTVSCTPST